MYVNRMTYSTRRSGAPPGILSDGDTVAWFDADESYMTKDGGNLVSQWADRSGNANHLLQVGVDSIKPIWSAAGLLFDGVDDFMDSSFTLIQPEFIYIVFKQVTRPGTRYIFDGITSASGGLYQGIAPILVAYAGSASPNNSNLPLDTWGIGRILFNGVSSKFTIDATTPVTGDFGASIMNGFTLGGRATGASNSNIQVKEIIIRKIADAAWAEAIIYNYLKSKYSL